MEYEPITILALLLFVLVPMFVILISWITYGIRQVRKGKSKYGFFRRMVDRFAGPVRTLSYISEKGPKFIYLDDFMFSMDNTYGKCKLRLVKLVGGEEINYEFIGNNPSETLILFFNWYDKNRETLIDAKDSLAKIQQLKRNLSN